VLLVDDEPAVLALLVGQLGHEFEVRTACSADQARRMLSDRPADIVLTDLQLPDASGIQLLDWVHRHAPRTARVLLTGTARVEDAADAINCCRVHRLVLKPWRTEDLLTTLRSVARGLMIERHNDELLDRLREANEKLGRVNEELERRVQERTAELKHTMDQLQLKNHMFEKMSLTDPLTGLPNRRAVELVARKEYLRRVRTPGPIGFGLVDADRFKQINSDHHLSGGDHALTWLGATLQGAVRAQDTVGRVGGEEFMVVAPNTDLDGAAALAERLRATVEGGECGFRGRPIRVTVSIGLAVAPAGAEIGYDQLREAAAALLAEAKATGRNKCVVRAV
jgi:diguanylate cyclase (GGDEF)-like protein